MFALLIVLPCVLALPTFKWVIGPGVIVPHPPNVTLQFPDSSFPVLGSGNPSDPNERMMFWTDGVTFRSIGSGLFPTQKTDPQTAVLTAGKLGTYDGNGNWLLYVQRQGGPTSPNLVGFSHVENHQWDCPGKYGEWNAGAVVTSNDNGVTWDRQGLAIWDQQPCNGTFGGAGYSVVLPNVLTGVGFIGFGGCNGFISEDAGGAAGTWKRYYNGSFTEPGIKGKSSCLPGLSPDICCPLVHWNYYLKAYVMTYTTWGSDNTTYITTSEDGITWGESSTFLQLDWPNSLAYPKIIGDTNTTHAGQTATFVYAGNPPAKGPYARDFVARTVTFTLL